MQSHVSGGTDLSRISLDLGQSDFFHLGESPRFKGIDFVEFMEISKMRENYVLLIPKIYEIFKYKRIEMGNHCQKQL